MRVFGKGMHWIQALGHGALAGCRRLGALTLFSLSLFSLLPEKGGARSLLRQCYLLGVCSFGIITISALFVGMVMGLQGYYTLSRLGAESALGQLVALSMVRELGPVLTALLYTGRAASTLSAEIALMKTTEQLKALEMMAINPKRFILWPRLMASIIAVVLLTQYFIVTSIVGGYALAHWKFGVTQAAFWNGIVLHAMDDWGVSVLKSVIFAVAIGCIAVERGYRAHPTPTGMARATTQSVIWSSIAILGIDVMVTGLFIGQWS